MKRGRLRVKKDYKINKWIIQGKKKSGLWVHAYSDEKSKKVKKFLSFDLKYDACGYLQGVIDWIKEKDYLQKPAFSPSRATVDSPLIHKKRNKSKNRIKKLSKRKNRKRK